MLIHIFQRWNFLCIVRPVLSCMTHTSNNFFQLISEKLKWCFQQLILLYSTKTTAFEPSHLPFPFKPYIRSCCLFRTIHFIFIGYKSHGYCGECEATLKIILFPVDRPGGLINADKVYFCHVSTLFSSFSNIFSIQKQKN